MVVISNNIIKCFQNENQLAVFDRGQVKLVETVLIGGKRDITSLKNTARKKLLWIFKFFYEGFGGRMINFTPIIKNRPNITGK